jgi:beta-glucanase (GH16 family)
MLRRLRRSLAPHHRKLAVGAAGVATAAAIAFPLLSSPGSINVFVGSTPTPSDPCAGQGFSFCDEFNGAAVDTTKWVAVNTHADLSNSEPGCYTSANATEGSGVLTETVEHRTFTCPDTTGSNDYPTAAIQTKTFSFTYGTVDVKAKVAGCTGCWPAIWMLGTDCQSPQWLVNGNDTAGCNWPAAGSQEIDIAEFLSSNFTTPWNNLITAGGTQSHQTSTLTNASTNFHIYTIVWSAGNLVFKVDGTTMNTYTTSVPSTPMFLIINSSVGANGGTINNTTLPATTTIDYVHVT